MRPSRSTCRRIQEGQIVNVFWRGKLIFVRNRSEKEIKESEDTKLSELMDPQPDSARVKEGHAKWLVVYGNCTHLGCVPIGHQGQYEGWSCPLPRLTLRHVRARAPGTGTDQPADPALRIPERHQDPDR